MTLLERLETLKTLPLLKGLQEKELKELAKIIKLEFYSKGKVILEEGSVGDSLYLLAEGRVRIEKKAAKNGDTFKELATLTMGDFFGEMAMAEGGVRSARALAVEDVLVFELQREALFQWLKNQPSMAMAFFMELIRSSSQRLRRTSSELALLFDLSTKVLEPFPSEKELAQKTLEHFSAHWDGQWAVAAYLYGEASQEISLTAAIGALSGEAKGLEVAKLEEVSPGRGKEGALRVVVPGAQKPMGYLLLSSREKVSPADQEEMARLSGTLAHILASAINQVRRLEEERLKARLQEAKGLVEKL